MGVLEVVVEVNGQQVDHSDRGQQTDHMARLGIHMGLMITAGTRGSQRDSIGGVRLTNDRYTEPECGGKRQLLCCY